MRWRSLAVGVLSLSLATPRRSPASDHLLFDDAELVTELEQRGLAFPDVIDAKGSAAIARAIGQDIDELQKRAPSDARRLFDPAWLSRGHFELTGVVNRVDRRGFDPAACGEVRLVYRLVLQNEGRPPARLPMTVNVRVPQPMPREDRTCRNVGTRWGRATTLLPFVLSQIGLATVEVNYQSVHVPATREDMDDSAEYILRAFRPESGELRQDTLFNTVRTELSEEERRELGTWVAANVDAIDAGTAVVLRRFLANVSVSVSPRALSRPENATFSRALGASRDAFNRVDFSRQSLVKTPELLLRRLDEMGCPGCHQTSGVAGFHLLGRERVARSHDAHAFGHSPHLARELEWRATGLERASNGLSPAPRPFASHPGGREGDEYGLTEGLRGWGCAAGLICRDAHGTAFGMCSVPMGGRLGRPCEDVRSTPSSRPEGPVVAALPADSRCPVPKASTDDAFCAPNSLSLSLSLSDLQGACVASAARSPAKFVAPRFVRGSRQPATRRNA